MTATFKILDDDDKDKDKGILKDGERRTIHMFDSKGDPLPGFTPVQIAIARTKDAMTSFDASMHRPGYRYAAPTADSAAQHQSTRFGVYDGAREKIYADRDREMADAWKSKSTDSDDDNAPPVGAYSADDASEGDLCTIDGRPGKLRAMDDNDNWLECIADDDDGGTGDSRTTHDTRTAQQIKDAAYAAYDSEIKDAWRNK